MTIPLRLKAPAEPLPTTRALLQQYYLPPAEPRSEARPELSRAELAFRIFAAFRAHPHINNVLTHISRAQNGATWSRRSIEFLTCRRPVRAFRHLRRTSST